MFSECINADWDCRVPTLEDRESDMIFGQPQLRCQNNEVYIDCQTVEEPTCKVLWLSILDRKLWEIKLLLLREKPS